MSVAEVNEGARIYSGQDMLDPFSLPAEAFAKAFQGMAATRPKAVRHDMSLAARRYLYAYTGVLRDATPHLDAMILRQLAYRNPVLNAIINTLLNQVAAHFTRPKHESAVGMRVVQKGKRKTLTPAAARKAEEIEEILYRGGVVTEHPRTGEPATWDGNYKRRGDSLDMAVRKLMRDRLTLDTICISIEGSPKLRGKAKQPVMHWVAEDAALARIADTDEYVPRLRGELDGKVTHVLMDPTMRDWGIMREYAWDEGAIAFGNPRTDFTAFGYGRSEIEQCLDAVLGVLYGLQSNREYFTDNHIPAGILNLVGTYQDPELKALRMKFKQEVGMPGHYYEFPIIATPPEKGTGAQWIPMQPRDRMDMVFRAFIEFCVAIASAVYGIAPEEFGFASFGGPSHALSEADPESTYKHSMHKGLVPKVLWLADFFTRSLVEKIDPDFEIEIQGLQNVWLPQEMMALERDSTLLGQGYTLNQVAARNDRPPIVDPIDIELWRELERFHESQTYATETERVRAQVQHYKALGGRLGSYPDAPAGDAKGMLEIWMSEHMQDQQMAKQMMGQLAMGHIQGQQQQEQQLQQAALQAGMAERQHSLQGEQQLQQLQASQQHEQGMAQTQHQQALQQAQVQHQQALGLNQVQHSQATELKGLEHQQGLEQLQVQGQQSVQQAQLQHEQQRQLQQEQAQAQQVAQQIEAQVSQGHDLKMALLSALISTVQGEQQQGYQQENAAAAASQSQEQEVLRSLLAAMGQQQQHGQQQELNEQQHGFSLEQSQQQHELGRQAAAEEGQRRGQLADQQHGHRQEETRSSKQLDQEFQREMAQAAMLKELLGVGMQESVAPRQVRREVGRAR